MTNRETIENEIDNLLNSSFNRNDVLKFAEQMAALARASALEEAALMVSKLAPNWSPETIAKEIRALNDKESK